MVILGIGTDIVECLRIGKMIEQYGETLPPAAFSPSGRFATANRRGTRSSILPAGGPPSRRSSRRWADRSRGISWTDIEIRRGENGQHQVMVCGVAKEVARERRSRRYSDHALALPDLRDGLCDGPGAEAGLWL